MREQNKIDISISHRWAGSYLDEWEFSLKNDKVLYHIIR